MSVRVSTETGTRRMLCSRSTSSYLPYAGFMMGWIVGVY
jgi:hypothetical protein